LAFVAAMAKGFDGGGTEGGTASVKGVLEEVAPGDGGRPTSGCFKEESRGLRNMRKSLAYSGPDQDGCGSGSTRHVREEREFKGPLYAKSRDFAMTGLLSLQCSGCTRGRPP
jgi:hypothetical protein